MMNKHTRTLKLERTEAIDILLALDAASTEGAKWEALANKIREQIDKQDEKDPGNKDLDIYL